MPSNPVLTIEVPGRAVSANARLGYNRKTGAKYLTKSAREWKQTVAEHSWFAWSTFIDQHAIMRSFRVPTPPFRIVCHVYGTRADADNLSKLILDGLKEGIGIDDKHFRTVEMHATAKGMKEPRTVISVYEAEEDDAIKAAS